MSARAPAIRARRRSSIQVSAVSRATRWIACTVRLWPIAQLPDDLDRVTAWVESITGLDLDDAGSIQVLDNARWLERRDKVIQQGGPPLTD